MPRPSLFAAALLTALLGFWSPWLEHPVAALRLNAYDLSEWVTFLPGVQSGELPFGRFTFLIPSACLAVLFGLAAARARRNRRWPDTALSWALAALGGLCTFAVFPYYPYLIDVPRNFFSPDYQEFQAQYAAAVLALAGLLAAFVVPDWVGRLAQVGLALIGAGVSAWALWMLQPVASQLLSAPWAAGWGWGLTMIGFAGALFTSGRPRG